MPIINRISTLQYMGNKSRMLENICIPIIEDAAIDMQFLHIKLSSATILSIMHMF